MSERVGTAINEQIGREFAASQQYVAIAVYYGAESLHELAAHFYRQAVEERNHAMMLVQYLLDADLPVVIPGVEAPRTEFDDGVAPVALALEQEKAVTRQIAELAALAREENDLVGEQFLHWFLQEQREEVASMSTLLAVVERAAASNILLAEDYLARVRVGNQSEGESVCLDITSGGTRAGNARFGAKISCQPGGRVAVPFEAPGSVPLGADGSFSFDADSGELAGSYIRGTVDAAGGAKGTLHIQLTFDYQGQRYDCATTTEWTATLQR